MGLMKKVNSKLLGIAIIFLTFFIIVEWFLIDNISEEIIRLTYETHYNQLTYQLEKEFNIMKVINEEIANNGNIRDILNENRTIDNLSEDDQLVMINLINMFEKVLQSSRFVETVNIASLKGNYLFSKGNLYSEFNLCDRQWFKNEYIKKNISTIVTGIHEDFTTGKDTIAIVSFIYSEDKQELLGGVVLDIFVDSLLEYINSTFSLGNLYSTIIEKTDEFDKIIEPNYKKDYYIKTFTSEALDENKIILIFDIASSYQSYMIKNHIGLTKLISVIIGLIITIGLVGAIQYSFKIPLKSINNLMELLEQLNGNTSLMKEKDGITQLEVLSNALGKSIDNRIKESIYYDFLTKLPNRKKMNIICKDLIKQNKEFALLFIDLNKFKTINDLFGHTVGDKLLIKFSQLMKEALRENGIVTRYSGDEFIVIYTNFQDEAQLIQYYEKEILPQFKHSLEISEDVKVQIEFSVGAAIYPKDGSDVEELINKSDFMMYKSKKVTGDNQIEFFNKNIYKEMVYLEILKNELKDALVNREFTIMYQPIVDENSVIRKVEALIRWNNKKLGNIAPDVFIKYAEETREIINIGYWIIEEAFKFISKNKLKIQVSINVSAIQLIDFHFVERVLEIITKYQVPYKKICFEITETILLDESSIAFNNIKQLRQLGIKFALDDFGTGYSSFNYLKKYSLDILKLDKTFLNSPSKVDFEVIRYIVMISKLQNMDVIIEGVETKEYFECLKNTKCDFFQGYYFYKPLTQEELLKLL